MTPKLELTWRPMRDEDRNYVVSSWLLSCAESSEFRSLGRRVYFELYAPVVERLIVRSTIAIASDPGMAADTVLGWMAVEGEDVLHYVLVKPRFRRFGIARWMTKDLAALPAIYTHRPTLAGSRLVGPSWTYDPMRRFERKSA